jgi:uncharacterized RDD family membrane protein YckC
MASEVMDSYRDPSSAPARRQTAENVIGFDPVALHAPFVLRCAAIAIDYILLIAVPVIGMILNQLGVTTSPTGIVASNSIWVFAGLVGLCDFVVLPSISGQSVGKMLCGLRIVRMDGRDASMRSLVLRNTVGYLITALTFGLGFFIAVLNRSGRTLHDFIGRTVVVHAVKSRRVQS